MKENYICWIKVSEESVCLFLDMIMLTSCSVYIVQRGRREGVSTETRGLPVCRGLGHSRLTNLKVARTTDACSEVRPMLLLYVVQHCLILCDPLIP